MQQGYGSADAGLKHEIKPVYPHQKRRRMNANSICYSILLPWLLFSLTYAVFSFNIHYRKPATTWFVALVGLVTVLSFGMSAYADKFKLPQYRETRLQEPMWYVVCFWSALLAWVLAIVLGDMNFYINLSPYYDSRGLNTYPNADVSVLRGQQVMDGGSVLFAEGTFIDFHKAEAFRNDDIYCVAPIAIGNKTLATYDFWAVGVGCCSGIAKDFACGEWNNPKARAGARLLADEQRPFYRLAVQQAEAAYNITATHPLFYHWVQDPVAKIERHHADGWTFYLVGVFSFLCFQCFLVAAAVLVHAKVVA